jgi:hypothetical protein
VLSRLGLRDSSDRDDSGADSRATSTRGGKEPSSGRWFGPGGGPPIEIDARGCAWPRYRLTWFRDDVTDVAEQDLYPFAENGLLVYTLPSSRQALIALFGRFQAPAHLWTGWGRATSPYGLLSFVRVKTAPVAEVTHGKSTPHTIPTGEVAHGERPPATVRTGDVVSNVRGSGPRSVFVLLAIVLPPVVLGNRSVPVTAYQASTRGAAPGGASSSQRKSHLDPVS